ncbi:unnamed protein product [Darwinula stevensoni]|uniref:Uncharacterized protein n=1 Tax=Darwinula stevensoni TaxID=69355 RepID=A0A7R9AA89_9CRUS|nr:unnamed protein product [Darwinula stevensoni]CAG0898148.1 unnamed protein product [Darwinula stevensoni]
MAMSSPVTLALSMPSSPEAASPVFRRKSRRSRPYERVRRREAPSLSPLPSPRPSPDRVPRPSSAPPAQSTLTEADPEDGDEGGRRQRYNFRNLPRKSYHEIGRHCVQKRRRRRNAAARAGAAVRAGAAALAEAAAGADIRPPPVRPAAIRPAARRPMADSIQPTKQRKNREDMPPPELELRPELEPPLEPPSDRPPADPWPTALLQDEAPWPAGDLWTPVLLGGHRFLSSQTPWPPQHEMTFGPSTRELSSDLDGKLSRSEGRLVVLAALMVLLCRRDTLRLPQEHLY